jgi:hypothetical protein
VLATLSATRTDSLLAAGKPTAEALTGGYELSFWIASGLVVLALVVAVIVLEPVKAPAHEEAEAGSPGEPAYSEAGGERSRAGVSAAP